MRDGSTFHRTWKCLKFPVTKPALRAAIPRWPMAERCKLGVTNGPWPTPILTPLWAKPDVAAALSWVSALQKKRSELRIQSHKLCCIVLDFELGMDHGPIMRSSNERQKGEQILQVLPP